MNLFDQIRSNPKFNSANSAQWFQSNVRQLAAAQNVKTKPMSLFTDNQTMLVSKPLPGHLIQFFYSPIGKDRLKYWDTFPLVIPFKQDAKHIWGLNIHYLPPITRFILFRKLLTIASDKNKSDISRLRLTWRMINSAARLPEVAPCVKCYLKKQIKSKFLQLKRSDWEIAIALPSEQFKQATIQEVWKDSKRKMRR